MGRWGDRMPRRGFLEASGSTALLCSIGGKGLEKATPRDIERTDRLAAKLERPPNARQDVVGPDDAPRPQPGGQRREYWIAARSLRWDIAPSGQDEWMRERVRGRRTFRAFVYQQYSAGFGGPVGAAGMPGPTIEGEVGDVITVHFRNADERLNQAVTMHPHGVKYSPQYDGSYLGLFTLAGGFVAPGEEFTYHWECTPDSVGVWPYHDHGPNHTLNHLRGLFGTVIVRPKGASKPDVEVVQFMHSFPPNVTRLDRIFQTINGRAYAGNAPTVRARPGQTVAWHVIGGDNNFHTFHVHGHRWRAPDGSFTDNPSFGPNETVSARWTEDNVGRWLYHCHVFSHQNAGMAGWYVVE